MIEICSAEKCVDVVECKVDITNLKTWQKSQNGAIHRVEDKVDKMILGLLGVLATAVMSLLGTVVLLLREGR